MENLNLLFYKTFYSKLGQKNFEDDIVAKSKEITDSLFYQTDYNAVSSEIAPQKFLLKTGYPGLLVGTGYAHGVDSDKDIKIGFSLDYVTGQPYIPGSSVKGLLRFYFKHSEVIQQLLGKDLSVSDVRALEKAIFETDDDAGADADIFFDAVIKCGDKEGRVLGFDSITPHGEDLTKNPVPIKIVKIMPDVVIEFSFNLKDTKAGNRTVTATEKEDLFKEILCNFGIGAKTNVGYGVLTAVDEKTEVFSYPQKNQRKEQPARTSESESSELVDNKTYDCVITGENEYSVFVCIEGTKIKGFMKKDWLKSESFKNGEKIKAAYKYTNNKGSHCFAFKGRR